MTLEKIFSEKKPIIGMVHVADLYSEKGLYYVMDRALADAYNLHLGGHGVDGLLVENWEERSDGPFVSKETLERMLRVTREVKGAVPIPIGVNVLHNDYRAAFAIAKELELEFVQLNVYSDRARTNFAHTHGVQFEVVVDVEDVKRHRQGRGAILLVNIHPKHYLPIGVNSWEELEPITASARRAIDYGADGIVVTKETGVRPDLAKLHDVRDFVYSHMPGFPVLAGSGTTKENIQTVLMRAGGAIVGTGLKIGGITDNAVDPRNVEAYMGAVGTARRTLTQQ